MAAEPVVAAVELEPAAAVGYGTAAAAVDGVGAELEIAPLPRAALPAAAAHAVVVVEKTAVAVEWQCKGCSQR